MDRTEVSKELLELPDLSEAHYLVFETFCAIRQEDRGVEVLTIWKVLPYATDHTRESFE